MLINNKLIINYVISVWEILNNRGVSFIFDFYYLKGVGILSRIIYKLTLNIATNVFYF